MRISPASLKALISGCMALCMAVANPLQAQIPDHIYKSNVASVKLFRSGDPYGYPLITLNSNDQMELHFDDLDADMKNYYYSFVLCNADWTPANIQPYDYTRGFLSNRITTYRNSSIALTRYTHYQASIPERNSAPSRAGNYLLKVFVNDDTSKLAFTKRFIVLTTKAVVGTQVLQPFNAAYYRTHQRLQVTVNTANAQINAFSPNDIKVVIVQNYAWPQAVYLDRPTIFRGNYYEYSDENTTVFQAGKEWRWLNLRSLQLLSDRVEYMVDTSKTRTEIYVKPDGERNSQVYVSYRDNNGLYTMENADGTNPYWQSDYAYVHFRYVPPGNRAYEGKSIYIYGELTQYETGASSKMEFNNEKGIYEKTLLLKQGYYNYSYVTKSDKPSNGNAVSLENTEGNYYGTENAYLVLVYYRPFGGRADELIGYSRVSSTILR